MLAPKNLTKLYYSISEVAEMFDVNTSLLRYWETEFSELKPKKSRKGDRQYTVKDIDIVAEIYTLVKERGFTLQGAQTEIKNKKILRKKTAPISKKLEDLRKKIIKLQKEFE